MLKFFICIVIFILAFGVGIQGYFGPPHSYKSIVQVFFKVLDNALWPIFGEVPVLEDIKENTENVISFSDMDTNAIRSYFGFISLMIYMFFASVLLINLLIAMFRFVPFYDK